MFAWVGSIQTPPRSLRCFFTEFFFFVCLFPSYNCTISSMSQFFVFFICFFVVFFFGGRASPFSFDWIVANAEQFSGQRYNKNSAPLHPPLVHPNHPAAPILSYIYSLCISLFCFLAFTPTYICLWVFSQQSPFTGGCDPAVVAATEPPPLPPSPPPPPPPPPAAPPLPLLSRSSLSLLSLSTASCSLLLLGNLSLLFSFFHFILRFWNQILTCRSVSARACDTSMRRFRVR